MKKILSILVICVFGGLVFFLILNRAQRNNTDSKGLTTSRTYWMFDGTSWKTNNTSPPCLEPLSFPAPADVSLASGIIYPGQIRGGDYKPHGGFRFDTLISNNVDVYAPIDAYLFRTARHFESGEIQYSLFFIHDCGIMYKLDHLKELTDAFESILSNIPMGEEGDSRTTEIAPVFVAKGELIATKVGFESNKNIFFDFGLYDLRRTNGVAYDSGFRSNHPNINEYGIYALCFLDYLEEKDKNIVKSLPAGGIEGKTSDYCK